MNAVFIMTLLGVEIHTFVFSSAILCYETEDC